MSKIKKTEALERKKVKRQPTVTKPLSKMVIYTFKNEERILNLTLLLLLSKSKDSSTQFNNKQINNPPVQCSPVASVEIGKTVIASAICL